MLAAELTQAGGQLRIELQSEESSGVVLPGGAGVIGRNLQQRGSPSKIVFPELGLALQDFAFEPLALPKGIVGILKRERIEGIGMAAVKGLIEGAELICEKAHGPAVGDDVMHGEEQHMVMVGESDESSADEGTSFEIEGLVGFGNTQSLEFSVGIGLVTEIVLYQEEGSVFSRGDALEGQPVDQRKGGPQSFMAEQDAIQRLAHGGVIELTPELKAQGHVISLAGTFQLG